ncbi:hypothetical protein DFJ63DRAFT_335980 [Scheffersomyces coipomensis]|uniref:uncharacterized protein n=1 Tax=Scheffersomyces coipomensis TaxID=1788519 RepID=UPI00315DC4E4
MTAFDEEEVFAAIESMSTNEGVKSILEGAIDLYQFLEVEPSCDLIEIRKQYRRKALKYHPDKVGGDVNKFNLLSKVYEILSSEGLRGQYDSIRLIRLNKEKNREQLLELTRQFQQELEKAEANATGTDQDFIQKRQYHNNLELLKEEGSRRRRQQEEELLKSQQNRGQATTQREQSYVSYKDLKPPSSYFKFPSSNDLTSYNAKVKWKFKPELKELITDDVIKEIMEIFGPIKSVEMLESENNNRYNYALIEYTNVQDYQKALDHDYKSSASLWDGTNARKLASLLRECTSTTSGSHKRHREEETDELSLEELVSKVKHHKNLSKQFKLPIKTHIENVDTILYRYVLGHLDQ